MHGVLDVANGNVDELFDELAYFLFLQRLRVVLVQHLQQRDKIIVGSNIFGRARTSPSRTRDLE
jgi:hypothetical protein